MKLVQVVRSDPFEEEEEATVERKQQMPQQSSGWSWSENQLAVFSAVADTRDSLSVVSVAGSGKTTTGVEIANRIDPELDAVYLAFNKRIVEELQRRLPPHVPAKTFHSALLRDYMQWLSKRTRQRPKVDAYKVRNIVADAINAGNLDVEEGKLYSQAIGKLVAYAKSVGIGVLVPDSPEHWSELVEHFGMTLEPGQEEDRLIVLSRRVLEENNRDVVVIDFDDMLYLSLVHCVPLTRYDVVLIDEAQDTNGVQRALLSKMLNPGGRVIAVGDPCQAIYGFRGASTDAMALIERDFMCTKLTLSVSYRCARAIVEEARKFVHHIEASSTAPEGSVRTLNEWSTATFVSGDAVLCRLNAPLVKLAYSMIAARVKCRILGREIGQGLVTLIRKMKADTLAALEKKLLSYRAAEISRLLARGKDNQAQAVDDKVNSIIAAVDGMNDGATVDELIDSLMSLFSDTSDDGVTLATVHKSKGSEWENVYILDPHLMPSKWAKQTWQQEQETYLQYVATTRAKLNLTYISSPQDD